MPGVKAILTEEDLPAPADSLTDNGTRIAANKLGERALTNEPLYQGEPILAVAAVDELTAAEAIEKIKLDLEPLPFVIDPLETLRPGSPNPRIGGNTWYREPPPAGAAGRGGRGAAPGPIQVKELKWTEADFDAAKDGQLPMGKIQEDPANAWTFGDVDAGFKKAALVLDETFITPDTSHHCLETRSAMAYWQNGKVFVYTGTQSTIQTVPAIARWLNIDPDKVVFISEYTGGGFGSKDHRRDFAHHPGPALQEVQRTGNDAPIARRRDLHRPRPAQHDGTRESWLRQGWPYRRPRHVLDDQHRAVRSGGRCTDLRTDGFPALSARDDAVPGLDRHDQYSASRRPECPWWTAGYFPDGADPRQSGSQAGSRSGCHPQNQRSRGQGAIRSRRSGASASMPPARLSRKRWIAGSEQFNWSERVARNPKRIGTKVRGVGVSMSTYSGGSTGFDGLMLIKPDGSLCFQSGIGNLGTESFSDVHRVAAEMLGVPWEKCDICWGTNAKNLPWSCVSGGSQTTHAMTRAAHAVAEEAKKRLQEIAAKSLGGSPEQYDVGNEKVFRKGGGASMTLAQAAQKAIQMGGIYDGHEVNPDVNRYTKQSLTALAGQGFLASARDKYPHDGQTRSYVRQLRRGRS